MSGCVNWAQTNGGPLLRCRGMDVVFSPSVVAGMKRAKQKQERALVIIGVSGQAGTSFTPKIADNP